MSSIENRPSLPAFAEQLQDNDNVKLFYLDPKKTALIDIKSLEHQGISLLKFHIDMRDISPKIYCNLQNISEHQHLLARLDGEKLILIPMKQAKIRMQKNITQHLGLQKNKSEKRVRKDGFISIANQKILQYYATTQLNFFLTNNPTDKGLLEFYLELSNFSPNGCFDVLGHGQEHTINIGNNHLIGPEQLAEVIQKHPKYSKGQPVRLWSCNTGKNPDGIAQKLATLLDVPVQAPSRLIWNYQHAGNYIFGSEDSTLTPQGILPDFDDKGDWVTFNPEPILNRQ